MPGRIRLITIAVAVVLGVAGCSGKDGSNTSVAGSNGFQLGDGQVATYAPGGRDMVGDVSGTTLAGKPLSLADYRGKVVVVDFWQAACGPCIGEEQYLESLAKTYQDKGVQFVGIDERDNESAAQSFEREFGVTYPSLFDRSDAFLLDFPGAAPPSTPTTIVIDRTGHIAARVSGSVLYTTLKTLIEKTLAEKVRA